MQSCCICGVPGTHTPSRAIAERSAAPPLVHARPCRSAAVLGEPALALFSRPPQWAQSGAEPSRSARGLLNGVEQALPQEPYARTAIALPLQELEAVHMPLDGAIAPGKREAGGDRREVLLEAVGKARERRNAAAVASVIQAVRASPRRSRTRARNP